MNHMEADMMPEPLKARRRAMKMQGIGAIACFALMICAVAMVGHMALRAAIALPVTLSQDVEAF